MQTIKINVADRILQTAEWGAFIAPISDSFPIVYRIADGAAKLFFSTTYSMWIPKDCWEFIKMTQQQEEPKEIPTAPNLQFSESFILKLVAIAKNEKMATDLL